MHPQESLRRFKEGTYTHQDLKILLDYYQSTQNATCYRLVRIAIKRMQVAELVKKSEPLRIQIVATSDDEKDEFKKFAWGDFWLQYELTRYFGSRNYLVTREKPFITLHLFGFPRTLPQNTYNIAWCTSHPELLTDKFSFIYDCIFSLGEPHCDALRKCGIDADPLAAASAKVPYPATEKAYPAIFIGNTKPGEGLRPCVQMLKETGYPFQVWGWGWEEHLPPETIGGHYFDYTLLNQLYANSRFVLNDHHRAMTAMEMVSPKNFDVCSSGGTLVCERNAGINRIFGDSVSQFSTADELKSILVGLDENIERKKSLTERAMKISLEYTFDRTIERIDRHLREETAQPISVSL